MLPQKKFYIMITRKKKKPKVKNLPNLRIGINIMIMKKKKKPKVKNLPNQRIGIIITIMRKKKKPKVKNLPNQRIGIRLTIMRKKKQKKKEKNFYKSMMTINLIQLLMLPQIIITMTIKTIMKKIVTTVALKMLFLKKIMIHVI